MNNKSKDGRRGLRFSAREVRAILLMLPLLAVLVWVVSVAVRPHFDDSAVVLGDNLAVGAQHSVAGASEHHELATQLFAFDPNEVAYEELRALGIPKNTAAGIIRYRRAGKVFRIPEDFAACYGVSDSMYAALKPYIIIGGEYAVTPKRYDNSYSRQARRPASDKQATLNTFAPNELSAEGFVRLGFSPKQAKVIINYRNKLGGFVSADDFARCYVVSEEMFARLKNYMVFQSADHKNPNVTTDDNQATDFRTAGIRSSAQPAKTTSVSAGKSSSRVEINTADSVQLVAVRGIGAKTASAIIAYRNRLGGYCNAAQICETGIVTERNWEMMREQIWADSCAIQKIDINFAAPNTVAKHPYIGARTLRKLLRNRQLKGGWSTIEDMLNDNTLTAEEAKKLAPYLQFRAVAR